MKNTASILRFLFTPLTVLFFFLTTAAWADLTDGLLGRWPAGADPLSFTAGSGLATSRDSVGTNTVTVCAWFNPRSTGAGGYGKIFDNGKFQMYLFAGARTTLGLTSDGMSSLNAAPVSFNQWQHVCAIRNSDGTGSIYLNGALANSGNTGSVSAGWVAINIGKGFDGQLDDVRIYNRVLSLEEIKSLNDTPQRGVNAPAPVIDITPPTVSITSPVADAVVSNTVTLTATASDNMDVANVQFKVDGNAVGPLLTTAPFTTTWNTSFASRGAHVITATATDISGNTATAQVLVSVPGIDVAHTPVDAINLIPDERRYKWQGAVGVPGGIPNRTTICANVKDAPYNAKGDGIADDTLAIVAALSSCAGKNQVVFLPEGTYKFTEIVIDQGTGRRSVNLTYSNVTIRGAGMGKTILNLNINNAIYVGNGDWPPPIPTVKITAGATRGSNSMTVDNPGGITEGKLITITQLNPDWVHYNERFYGNGPGDDGHDKDRLMAITMKVVKKNGNIITLEHPLPIDMPNSPMITVWNYLVSGTGFEDMTLDMTNTSKDAASGILWNQVYGCWVKGVEIKNSPNRFLWFNTAANCEVRDNYFHDATVLKKEGLDLYQNDSFFLIENNTLVRAGNPMIILGDFGGGVSANVVAYNYLEDQQAISDAPENVASYALSDNHGPHNMFNLFEGNVAQNFASDGYYGSASHTTLFRNRFTGAYDRKRFIEEYAINLAHWATNYNMIGNVLGTGEGYSTIYQASGSAYLKGVIYKLNYPNCCNYGYDGVASNPVQSTYYDTNVEGSAIFHGNFDYATNSAIWDSNAADHTLPSSLYYTDGKPLWWPSNVAWPPIGPDVEGLADKIPAQKCYAQGKTPNCSSDNLGNLLFGDVNSDGNVNLYDASLVAQYAIALPVANFNDVVADVSGDGNVNLYDASLIAQYAVGLITKFPRG